VQLRQLPRRETSPSRPPRPFSRRPSARGGRSAGFPAHWPADRPCARDRAPADPPTL